MNNLTKEQIDRAIKSCKCRIESYREHLKMPNHCGEGRCEHSIEIELVKIAALQNERERNERERLEGCKYCLNEDVLTFDDDYNELDGAPAHFCPICGRDLREVK